MIIFSGIIETNVDRFKVAHEIRQRSFRLGFLVREVGDRPFVSLNKEYGKKRREEKKDISPKNENSYSNSIITLIIERRSDWS